MTNGFTRLVLILLLLPAALQAAGYPAPVEGDMIVRDFRFDKAHPPGAGGPPV